MYCTTLNLLRDCLWVGWPYPWAELVRIHLVWFQNHREDTGFWPLLNVLERTKTSSQPFREPMHIRTALGIVSDLSERYRIQMWVKCITIKRLYLQKSKSVRTTQNSMIDNHQSEWDCHLWMRCSSRRETIIISHFNFLSFMPISFSSLQIHTTITGSISFASVEWPAIWNVLAFDLW